MERLCCFFCGLRSAGVGSEFVMELARTTLTPMDFDGSLGYQARSVLEKVGVSEGERVTILACAGKLAGAGVSLQYHRAYFQNKTLSVGGADAGPCFQDFSLVPGEILLVYPNDHSAKDKMIVEMLTRAQTHVVGPECFIDLCKIIPKEEALVIQNDFDATLYPDLRIEGLNISTPKHDRNTRILWRHQLLELEEEISEYSGGVRLVIIDGLLAIEDPRMPGRQDEPCLSMWLRLLKRCLGPTENFILVVTLPRQDFLFSETPLHSFEIIKRDLPNVLK